MRLRPIRTYLPLLLVALLAMASWGCPGAARGLYGRHEGPGKVTEVRRPATTNQLRDEAQRALRPKAASKQILFGDLHVHTTFSLDAYLTSLPMMQGEGAHPPADACDFARFCSALDFWSINDHAEDLTPQHWRETVQSIQQCNAVAMGEGGDPDMVTYLGWEWTQVGRTPDTHYGHKNVIVRHTDDARVPARPIAAANETSGVLDMFDEQTRGLMALGGGFRRRYLDFNKYVQELVDADRCPSGVDVRLLPTDCMEFAATPNELFGKLDQWGYDALVIPHGTTWGFYTPAGSTWDKQLVGAMHDPKRQVLFEIFSGHGDGEVYRDWRAVRWDAQGKPICPPATAEYLPSCWRAGEIIYARCIAEGAAAAECEGRAAEARQRYAEMGNIGHYTVPGAQPDDWLDAGQCRDCAQPSFNYRPGGSAQYVAALGNFDDESAAPRRFRFGFIGSSDNHTARPGTGYKEYDRREMTEASLNDPDNRDQREPIARSVPFDPKEDGVAGFKLVETERQASFFMTGGLAAVHAEGRDRDAIWEAMQRREVYATSGDRILLWFDLENGPEGLAPMGAEVGMGEAPRFRVRAVGAFEQQPGCPDYSVRSLSPVRLQYLCRGECYHPSDLRKPITRVEVVRIRPQQTKGEPIAPLIEDPWKVLECPADRAGCDVGFEDPDFVSGGRETLYYVRALQAPTPAINAGNLRCERDAEGRCTKVQPCADPGTSYQDDCLAPMEERAWSSPIAVLPVAPAEGDGG